MPSVEDIATARTRLPSRCCATSAVVLTRPIGLSASTLSALWMAGMASGANSTSMTGPMTRTMRPTLVAFSVMGAVLPYFSF